MSLSLSLFCCIIIHSGSMLFLKYLNQDAIRIMLPVSSFVICILLSARNILKPGLGSNKSHDIGIM